jgi:prevent-host-death family protein
MNEISISEFKAKCLGLIDEVQKTRQPLRIMRRGKPVAEVIPAGPDHTRKFVGDLVGTGKIVGDIVGHVIDVEDMEAYQNRGCFWIRIFGSGASWSPSAWDGG